MSINILDINDNSPIFVKPVYNLNVSEAAGQNTWLTRVRATDRDYGTNGTVTYAIIGGNGDGNFRIDGTLGERNILTVFIVLSPRQNIDDMGNDR